MEYESNWLEFVAFARHHWRSFVIACAGAAALATAITLLLPKRYTATASILINPPAGNDPRAATVVSPVYLESLKTYELIASNDSLFLQAADRLRLREKYPHTTLDGLKRKALKVAKPPNTKVLEISATLNDPKDAQALARFVAVQTIELSKSFDRRAQADATGEAERLLAQAQVRLEAAEKARTDGGRAAPVEALKDRVENLNELHGGIQSDLAKVRAELAYYAAQLSADRGGKRSSDWVQAQVVALQARAKALEAQDRDTASEVNAQAALLDKRMILRESVDAEIKAARAEVETATTRLNDIRASSVFHGERLELIDPGVVPERPSYPSLPLNAFVAVSAAFLATTAYLALRFSGPRVRAPREIREYSLR